jgi:hypothetical protein
MNKVAKPFKKIVREFQFGTIVLSVGGPLLSLWLDTRMPDESAASADPFGFLYSVLSALAVYGLKGYLFSSSDVKITGWKPRC